MRAQIISMDFIMNAVLYMFVLSIFFFALKDNYFTSSKSLDIGSDLIFTKFENIFEDDYKILDRDHFIRSFATFAMGGYNSTKAYELYFQEYESPGYHQMDYCIFLKDGNDIILNVKANRMPDYYISIIDRKCGDEPDFRYNQMPYCPGDMESVLLTKPIYYNRKIMLLNVLVCAK